MIRNIFYFKAQHTEVRAKARSLQKEGSTTIPLYETAYLGVFARYLTALSYYGMVLLKEQGVFSSFEDLIGSEDRCYQIETLVVGEAISIIRSAYPDWILKAANPRLNLPQNDEAWKTFKEKMYNEVILKIEPSLRK
jgi:hypothetical protein